MCYFCHANAQPLHFCRATCTTQFKSALWEFPIRNPGLEGTSPAVAGTQSHNPFHIPITGVYDSCYAIELQSTGFLGQDCWYSYLTCLPGTEIQRHQPSSCSATLGFGQERLSCSIRRGIRNVPSAEQHAELYQYRHILANLRLNDSLIFSCSPICGLILQSEMQGISAATWAASIFFPYKRIRFKASVLSGTQGLEVSKSKPST